MKTNKIIEIIKGIAYHGTHVDMRLNADLVMQQITRVVPLRGDKVPPMAVMARQGEPGIILGFNAEKLKAFTPGQLKTMMIHESQHLLAGDLNAGVAYKESRDWFNGWPGDYLHNVARDCQINDTLMTMGYEYIPNGAYGTEMLGRNTSHDDIEVVMREIAAKFPPPPQDESNGDTSQSVQDVLQQADKGSEGRSVEREWGGPSAAKPAVVLAGEEQARWERFMAETLDSSKYRESWRDIPKRFSGVDGFLNRDIMLPRRVTLPRKTAVIAIDVSGSMDERGVNRLCSLVRNSGATYELDVVLFNTDVIPWPNFRKSMEMPARGGGTDFAPVEAYIAKKVRYPDAILVLTDGQAEMIKPRMPGNWTWVIYGASAEQFRAESGMRSVDLDAIIKRGR